MPSWIPAWESHSLMEKWAAAYDTRVRMGPDLPSRMGKVFADKLGQKLVVACKERVEAFKKIQKRIVTPYTAV
eukprot:1206850-Prorocentrum_lima.AAC.1